MKQAQQTKTQKEKENLQSDSTNERQERIRKNQQRA